MPYENMDIVKLVSCSESSSYHDTMKATRAKSRHMHGSVSLCISRAQ
jgi:hypothetical protein